MQKTALEFDSQKLRGKGMHPPLAVANTLAGGGRGAVFPNAAPLPAGGKACACGGGCPRCRQQSAGQTHRAVAVARDRDEQEADRVAEGIARTPMASANASAGAAPLRSPRLAARPASAARAPALPLAPAPAIVGAVLASPGAPLAAETRRFMESRLRADFSDVRVHADGHAAQSARALNAQAYTVGHHLVFAAGRYAPQTAAGRGLLAHELTHVRQQRGLAAARLQRAPAAPAASRPPFDDQPEAFRRILSASLGAQPSAFGCRADQDAADCFNRLDGKLRLVLVGLYQRLSGAGLWGHVTSIDNVWGRGAGGAGLTVADAKAFFLDVATSGRFCRDLRLGALLHAGTTSMREISADDGLHLAIGPGNHFSAHIDAVSPVAGREPNGVCRYDPIRAETHIGREVVPLGVPGLQIFPEPRQSFGPAERASPPPDIIRWTIPIPGT